MVLSAGVLVWFLNASVAKRVLPSRLRAPVAGSWPTLGAQAPVDEDLAVLTNQPRGAVRILGTRAWPSLRLMAVLDFDQRPRLVGFDPGFVGPDFVEFYGIDAGRRSCYLVSEGHSSALREVEIVAHQITTLNMPELVPQTTRRVVLEGVPAGEATLLLEYESADLLHRWRGESIELTSPLTQPKQITVSLPAGASGTSTGGKRRLGMVYIPEASSGDLVVRLREGDREVRLAEAAEAGAPAEAQYAIALSAGLRVTVEAALPTAKNLLAVLRPDEWTVPPKVHTWFAQPLGQPAAIEGVGDGEAWVGVGLERLGRYVLWRRQATGAGVVARVAPAQLSSPQLAAFQDENARLPLWIRSMGREDLEARGSRAEHDFGPGQEWVHERIPGGKWSRLAAWVDGDGGRDEVGAKSVALPLPAAARPGDALSLVVRVPHCPRGQGERFVLEHTWDGLLTWPALPDGLVDGSLHRRGQRIASLHGAIAEGTFLGRGSAWTDSDEVREDWRRIDLRAIDGAGRGVAGVEVFSEKGGDPVGKTDSDGRFQVERTVPARRPTFLSMRGPGSFTTNGYCAGVQLDMLLADEVGVAVDWQTLQALLGVELDSLGVDSVMLGRQPRGETALLGRGNRVTIAPNAVVEFAGGRDGNDVWGWFGDGALTSVAQSRAAGGAPAATAEIVLVNYAADRSVHVSLPRTEVRVGLGQGRLQRMVVHSPARIALTSVVVSGRERQEILVDEGVAAELAAGDVLVVTYRGR